MNKENAGNGALDQTELSRYPGYLLARARWQAFRNFERNIGRPLSLRPVEYSILLLLHTNHGASQRQLAQALGVAAPNMTGILRRLQERGLIERVRAEEDRRMQSITLSAKGRKLLQRARDAGRDMDTAWLARLSPGEQALLMELLAKLSQPAAPPEGGATDE